MELTKTQLRQAIKEELESQLNLHEIAIDDFDLDKLDDFDFGELAGDFDISDVAGLAGTALGGPIGGAIGKYGAKYLPDLVKGVGSVVGDVASGVGSAVGGVAKGVGNVVSGIGSLFGLEEELVHQIINEELNIILNEKECRKQKI
jgi:hypothetical protein